MGMFDDVREEFCDTVFTPKSTQVHAVPERGNQGQTQHKDSAAGTAYAALVARRRCDDARSRQRRREAIRSGYFTTTQNDEKLCCALFSFHRFTKTRFTESTGAWIARMLTVTLLSHSLWA